jgi:hypothetical protein
MGALYEGSTLGVGLMTWSAPRTLATTLSHYAESALLQLADEVFVLLHEAARTRGPIAEALAPVSRQPSGPPGTPAPA